MFPATVAILAEAYASYDVPFFEAVPMAVSGGKRPEPEPVRAEEIDNNAALTQLTSMLGGTSFGKK